jgi:hypothetical protein
MLNPSTADEQKNDPTVERCQRRATSLGFGGMVVVNLFALRSTDPAMLYTNPSPVSHPSEPDRNDRSIKRAIFFCKNAVAAWGSHGRFTERAKQVMHHIRFCDNLTCLGTTKDGHPRHPLYVGYDVPLQPFTIGGSL